MSTRMPTLETTTKTTIRDGFADLGEVRLHYVEAGEGPLVVLLHGFPEFWYGWRFQITALAEAGFRVVAPDMRGYNLSSKPEGVGAYQLDLLARDIRGLIRERGEERAFVAGHDWGGAVAWQLAMSNPEAVERLAILNIPHPRRMIHGLRMPQQLARSWYVLFFQLPWLPEQLVSRFRVAFSDARPGAFTEADLRRYEEAWAQPGAPTAMLNYYRAAARRNPLKADGQIRPVAAPTLVIWGQNDRALRAQLAEPERRDVPKLEGVVRFEDASHWVLQDEPEGVNELLIEFFGERS